MIDRHASIRSRPPRRWCAGWRRAGLALAAGAMALSAWADPPAPTGGPRKSVFVDVVGAVEAMSENRQPVGTTAEGLNAMWVDALMRTGRFVVVERVALGEIGLEQDLGRRGETTAPTAARTGRMIGASAIVRATVTSFGPAAQGSSVRIGVPLGRWIDGVAGASEQRQVVEFGVRLIDTTTGQIIASTRARGEAISKDTRVAAVHTGSGANVGADTFRQTPLGEAASQAIEQAVRQIVQAMDRVPWSASVVEVIDGEVYVSAGADQQLQPGTALKVLRPGRALVDPASGAVLDVLMSPVGTLRVETAREKVSVARVTSGESPLRGDVVKLE